MRERVNIWMGLGENSRQQREHFHMWLHHSSSVQGWLPDVLCNAAEYLGGWWGWGDSTKLTESVALNLVRLIFKYAWKNHLLNLSLALLFVLVSLYGWPRIDIIVVSTGSVERTEPPLGQRSKRNRLKII